MQQGGGMNEFDDGGQAVMMRPLVSMSISEQQYQHRPYALAPCTDDVVCNLVDQRHIGIQLLLDDLIHGFHFGGNGLIDQVLPGGGRHGRYTRESRGNRKNCETRNYTMAHLSLLINPESGVGKIVVRGWHRVL